jgi:hypothetical protein
MRNKGLKRAKEKVQIKDSENRSKKESRGIERNTGMRCITTFRSTTDRIYDGGPIRI